MRLTCAALAMLAASPLAYVTSAQAQTQPRTSAAWPHDRSDLAPDKEARFGILPNGMRYILRHNNTPPGGASLRLRIAAGSLNEADDQRGVAHFLEHLALNETSNLPEGELMRRLERAGLQMGPDSNAETGLDQTVYKLDLPRADAPSIDTALLVLREVASEATLRDEVVDRERGVVLAEGRARDNAAFRGAEIELAQHFGSDPLGARLPIGLPEVIRTVTPERIRAFYRSHYRPERVTLVAAGDFDLAEMEAKIRARFGDWRGQGPAPAALPALAAPATGLRSASVIAPDAAQSLTLSWSMPRASGEDNRAARLRAIRQALAMTLFNERLESAATADEAPFIGGQTAWERVGNRAEIFRLNIMVAPGGMARALRGLEQEHRRVLEHGFSKDELARSARDMRAAFVHRTSSIDLVDKMVWSVGEGMVFTTPASETLLFDEVIGEITAEQITATFRELSAGSDPLILMSGAQAELTDAAARTAWVNARAVPVTASRASAAAEWPYASFGRAGEVAQRQQVEAIGATSVRFRNGVRLIIKPTSFDAYSVVTSVHFGSGLLSLPATATNAAWSVPMQSLTAGGTGALDAGQIRSLMSGADVQVAATMDEDRLIMHAATARRNLARQFQLLAAYATDPGFRARSWTRFLDLGGTMQNQFEASATGVLQRDLPSLLRGGDRRWAIPGREEMAAMPASALSDLLRPPLTTAPISIVIVGDVDVDEAIDEVAATFGALPAREPAAPALTPYRFPAPGRVTRTHGGRPDQAAGLIAWKTGGYYGDRNRMLGLTLLARVFELRLNEEVRERQGAAYVPTAGVDESRTLSDFGYLFAAVELPPQAIDGFFGDVEAIARSLRDQPISADELERARRPLVEQMERDRRSDNNWWLAHLGWAGDDPDRVEGMVEAPRIVRETTAADLQRLARTYLVEGASWQLAVLPRTP